MALADIEGARIHLRELTISHHMASWESIQEILIRHYTRQLLHEMYKVMSNLKNYYGATSIHHFADIFQQIEISTVSHPILSFVLINRSSCPSCILY